MKNISQILSAARSGFNNFVKEKGNKINPVVFKGYLYEEYGLGDVLIHPLESLYK